MAERTPLVFGQGLDRESGVLAARQGSMEDLRNIITRRGKVQIRKGVEETVTFTDTNGDPVTHILAGQAIKGDKTGLIVAYQNDSNAADYGKVLTYLVPGDGSSTTFLGEWFTISDPANNDIPVVITTEVFGKVFLADNTLARSDREPTVYYDSLGADSLQTLTADFEDSGSQFPIKFRGVTKHLDYLVGWGYGIPSRQRPELVRTSLPAEPTKFRAEHYSIAGNRNDPVVTCESSAQGLVVFKETEFYLLEGTGARNFGLRIADERFGCAGPRLAVSVAGRIYFWSNQGPRVTEGGPSQDLALPLALDEFEPDDLSAKGLDSEAWAAYIPSERVVVFFFDQRGYILHVRRPQQLRWSYWELPFTPECGFQLYEGESIDTTAPQGHPEWLRNGDPRGTGEIRPTWKNINPRGLDVVDIFLRPSTQLAGNDAWRMDSDDDGDGVVDGWTKFEAAGHTVAFALENDAQKVDVTGSTAASDSGVERVIDGIEAGKDYTFGPELDTDGFTGGAEAFMELEWRESDDTPISTVTAGGWSGLSDFERRYEYDATAPANAAKVRVRLIVRTAASGEVGTAWFRLFMAVKVEDQGDWYREAITQTAPADGSEDDDLLSGLGSDAFMEVALRYRNGTKVTAGYETQNQDPDAWPDESKGVATTPAGTFNAPTITGDWYTTAYLATNDTYAMRADLDIQLDDTTVEEIKRVDDEGGTWELQIWRRIPEWEPEPLDAEYNTSFSESDFQKVRGVSSFPSGAGIDDWDPDSNTFRLVDTALDDVRSLYWEAQEFEYKVRLRIEGESSVVVTDFSDITKRWPGRWQKPTNIRTEEPTDFPEPDDDFDVGDGGNGQIVVVADHPTEFYEDAVKPLLGSDEDYSQIVSVLAGQPPSPNSQVFQPYIRIRYRNVTQGESFQYFGGYTLSRWDAEVGLSASSIQIGGLTTGETYEFQVKAHIEVSSDKGVRGPHVEGRWSDVLEVVP